MSGGWRDAAAQGQDRPPPRPSLFLRSTRKLASQVTAPKIPVRLQLTVSCYLDDDVWTPTNLGHCRPARP